MYRSRLAFALAMVALAAILVPSTLTAQITFERTYGDSWNDEGYSVRQTFDGGYIVTGYKWLAHSGGAEVYLVRTDSVGDTVWTRAYGGVGEEIGYDVRQTMDSGFVVVGSTNTFSAGYQDVWLVKTNANGDTLWARSYGDTYPDVGYSVRQTFDGGYVVAGATSSYGTGGGDVYLIRTNSSGDTLWTRCFGGVSGDGGQSVQQTTDSGFVIAGFTGSFGAGKADFYLIRTDADGDTLWTKTYGGARRDWGYSVQQTADSGFVVAGLTCSFADTLGDFWLIKTDAVGDTLWTRTYGGTRSDVGRSVQQTTDGGFVVAGSARSFGAGARDVYLIRTDSDGDTLWTRTFGGVDDDSGFSVQQTYDGGYVVAGCHLPAHQWDVFLIKTGPDGTVAVEEPKASPTRAPALSLSCEPNPFAGTTTIHLTPFASRYSPFALRIYDAQGRAVRSFSSLLSPPSSLTWDGRDDKDQMLPSGTYFLRLDAAGQYASTRLVLQR